MGLALFGGLLAAEVAAVFGTTLSFTPRLAPNGSAGFFVVSVLVWLTLWTVGGVADKDRFVGAGDD